jgi:two-component system response regulator YesN
MVVDDEPVVRRGIRESIDWKSHDVVIVAEAGDGETATRLALEQRPDVIIADIRMPKRNGIEFAKTVKRECPNTHVVMLSGYADFAYAQEAVRLGATDYLLKPVGADQLVELISRIRDELCHVAEAHREHRNRTLHQERIVEDLLLNDPQSAVAEDGNLARLLDLTETADALIVAVVELDETGQYVHPEQGSHRLASVQQFAEMLLDHFANLGGAASRLDSGRVAGIVPAHDETSEAISSLCIAAREDAETYEVGTVTIGLSRVHAHTNRITPAFQEALQAVRSKAYLGTGRTIRYREAIETACVPLEYPTKSEAELVHALREADQRAVRDTADSLAAWLKEQRADIEPVQQVVLRVYFACVHAVNELGIATDQVVETDPPPHIQVQRCRTYRDVSTWLRERCSALAEHVRQQHTTPYRHFVARATRYIEENYRIGVTLHDVAEEVCVTPNYLSRMFHEQTGRTFKQWLHDVQIREAKQLLESTALKTYEIAREVGYRDYKYFSRTFRKLVGCSPGEYRDRVAARSNARR